MKRILIIIFLLFIFFTADSDIMAAYLYFEPINNKVSVGQEVEIKIKINTEDDAPLTADAVVLFDSNSLDLVSVNPVGNGENFFPRLVQKISANKAVIGGSIDGAGSPKIGQGTVAVMKFKSNAVGENLITFSCSTGKKSDSNINLKKSGQVLDIIDCNKINQSYILVEAQAQTTPSYPGGPTPILTPTSAATGTQTTPIPTSSPIISLTPSPIPTAIATLIPTLVPTVYLTSFPPSPTATSSATISATLIPTVPTSMPLSPTPSPTLELSGISSQTINFAMFGILLIGASFLIKLMIKI